MNITTAQDTANLLMFLSVRSKRFERLERFELSSSEKVGSLRIRSPDPLQTPLCAQPFSASGTIHRAATCRAPPRVSGATWESSSSSCLKSTFRLASKQTK